MKAQRVLLAIILAAAAVTLGAPGASAEHHLPTDPARDGCRRAVGTDGGYLSIHHVPNGLYGNGGADQIYNAVETPRANEFQARAGIVGIGHSQPLAHTDVVAIGFWYEQTGDSACEDELGFNTFLPDSSGDTAARARCASYHASHRCNRHELEFDLDDISHGNTPCSGSACDNKGWHSTTTKARATGCHELSHVHGLLHTNRTNEAVHGYGCVALGDNPDPNDPDGKFSGVGSNVQSLSPEDLYHLEWYRT